MRPALAAASLLLALLSAAYYTYDRRQRGAAEQFIRDFTFEQRRPITAEESRYTITFDAANEVLATGAVDDAFGSVNFSLFTDEERRWWIESVSRTPQEVTAGQKLQLDAVAARPGWPLHYVRLGQLAFATISPAAETSEHAKWLRPLEQAISWAPGSDRAVAFAAAAMLQYAPLLPPDAQLRIPKHVGRAFEDVPFVRRSFTRAAAVLGAQQAMQLVPDDAPVLRGAMLGALSERQILVASRLAERWEREELKLRERDLVKLRETVARGDVVRMRATANDWLGTHPPRDFGSPLAERQLLEVLALFPPAFAGDWRSDGRAEVVRYFMNGRMGGTGRGVLKSAVDALAGTPVPVTARAEIASGNLYEAETIFVQSGGLGGFEWTPFLIELSDAHRRNGNAPKAREALTLISAAAASECDVLLARRRVAAMDSQVPTVRELSQELATAPRRFDSNAWSPGGDLSICIDPTTLTRKRVSVTIRTAEPLLLDYGWDSARSGTTLVQPPGLTLIIPTESREGRHTLWVRERQKEDLVLSRTAVLE